MKWGKLIFSTAFLGVSLASCGGSNASSLNPFDAKYEVSYEFASNLANTWKASVDESIEYIAHLTINSVDLDVQYRFKADYRGHPGQIFNYIEGSIDTNYSTISDTSEHFRIMIYLMALLVLKRMNQIQNITQNITIILMII